MRRCRLSNHSQNSLNDRKYLGSSGGLTESPEVDKTGGSKISRACPMWTSDGVHMDFWTERKTMIDIRADKSHTIQVRSVLKMGAGRKDEDRVVSILCEQDA